MTVSWEPRHCPGRKARGQKPQVRPGEAAGNRRAGRQTVGGTGEQMIPESNRRMWIPAPLPRFPAQSFASPWNFL